MPALYVFDPGPDGLARRRGVARRGAPAGTLALLVYQGVLLTELARAADIVLPGAAWVEKEATYTNDQGRVQGAAKVFDAPGEARDDREIFLAVAKATGQAVPFASVAERACGARRGARREPRVRRHRDHRSSRGRVSARNWLQASNPSERWKWDFMFQDLPPVKFDWMPLPSSRPDVIPLRPVEELERQKGD